MSLKMVLGSDAMNTKKLILFNKIELRGDRRLTNQIPLETLIIFDIREQKIESRGARDSAEQLKGGYKS